MNTDQVLSEQKTTPTNRQTFNNNIHKRVLSMGATGVTVKAMKNTHPLPPTGKKHQRTNLSFIYSLIYSPPGNHSLKHYPALLNDLETHSFVQKPVMLNYTDAPERPLASRRRKDIIELRKYRRQKKRDSKIVGRKIDSSKIRTKSKVLSVEHRWMQKKPKQIRNATDRK